MHGSYHGSSIDAIQIESPPLFRMAEHREQYAKALAKTIAQFLDLHYTNWQQNTKYGYNKHKHSTSKRPRKDQNIFPLILLPLTLIIVLGAGIVFMIFRTEWQAKDKYSLLGQEDEERADMRVPSTR
mgnify:CR=1 FL=1